MTEFLVSTATECGLLVGLFIGFLLLIWAAWRFHLVERYVFANVFVMLAVVRLIKRIPPLKRAIVRLLEWSSKRPEFKYPDIPELDGLL